MGLGHPEHKSVLGDAGVVHKDVDPAEIGENLIHDIVRFLEVRGVGGVSLYLVAVSLDVLDSLLSDFIDHKVGESHIGSLGGEFHCDCLSDSSCGARYKGDLSV